MRSLCIRPRLYCIPPCLLPTYLQSYHNNWCTNKGWRKRKWILKPKISAYFLLQADCTVWQYRLWSFKSGDKKLEIFLPKKQQTQRKLLKFENWFSGEVSKSAKIWLSKSIFCVKRSESFSVFFIEQYQFRCTFFVIVFFW